MVYNKTILSIILGIVVSILFNIIYYKIIDKKSTIRILSKSVSENYLSFEPVLLRGRLVNTFDILCWGKECLPFTKKRSNYRINFIKEVNQILDKDKNSIVFVSLFLVDDLLSDLRFYIRNPIFIDTKVLGISYYADEIFFKKYRTRFKLAYNYHFCNHSLKHSMRRKINYFNDLSDIFKLYQNNIINYPDHIKNSCNSNFFNELRANQINYIIDEKKYLQNEKNGNFMLDESITNNIKIIFCKENLCLATI